MRAHLRCVLAMRLAPLPAYHSLLGPRDVGFQLRGAFLWVLGVKHNAVSLPGLGAVPIWLFGGSGGRRGPPGEFTQRKSGCFRVLPL